MTATYSATCKAALGEAELREFELPTSGPGRRPRKRAATSHSPVVRSGNSREIFHERV
jgi:hypothetical protein